MKRARRKGLNREMTLGISLERGPGGPRCVQHEQTLLKCSHVSRHSESQCRVPERSGLGATFRKLLNTGEAQVADSGNCCHGDAFQLIWRSVSYQSAVGPLAQSLSSRQSVGSRHLPVANLAPVVGNRSARGCLSNNNRRSPTGYRPPR